MERASKVFLLVVFLFLFMIAFHWMVKYLNPPTQDDIAWTLSVQIALLSLMVVAGGIFGTYMGLMKMEEFQSRFTELENKLNAKIESDLEAAVDSARGITGSPATMEQDAGPPMSFVAWSGENEEDDGPEH